MLLGYAPKASSTDEKFLDYKSKLIDAIERCCNCYEKAAQLFNKLGNKFLESKAYGLAASNYLELAELKNDKAVRREVRNGLVITYAMDTSIGKAITAYHNAALAMYDIGVKYRNSGEIDKAYVIIGNMGDAYLSIGLLYESEDIYLAIENLFSAAGAYRESGLLAKKVGIPTIVTHARLEWHHAYRSIPEFFRGEHGYYTADDMKRAVKVYNKIIELAKKTGNQKMICDSSKAIMTLSSVTNEPKNSIKSCQEICESTSEFAILPIDLSTKQLGMEDKQVVWSSLKRFTDDPKQGTYQLISHLELRLRSYIKAKFVSTNPTKWFEVYVIPALSQSDLNQINSNYTRETGKNPTDLLNEDNPLNYANLNHLQIIISNTRNWNGFFKNEFVSLEEFNANMSIIVRIRHPTMHIRQMDIFEAAVTPIIWMLEKIGIG